MNDQWLERDRPPRLERRYLFEAYSDLRDFLDRAAALSEREGYYPDMGFGRDYLNVTIRPEESEAIISESQRAFARELDRLGSHDRGMTEAAG